MSENEESKQGEETGTVPRQRRSKLTASDVGSSAQITDAVRIGSLTFCRLKGYSNGVASRLEVFLGEAGDSEREKTISEWEAIHEKAMNRITN